MEEILIIFAINLAFGTYRCKGLIDIESALNNHTTLSSWGSGYKWLITKL